MPWGAKWPGTLRKQQVGNLAGRESVEGDATGRGGTGRRRWPWERSLGAEEGCSQAHIHQCSPHPNPGGWLPIWGGGQKVSLKRLVWKDRYSFRYQKRDGLKDRAHRADAAERLNPACTWASKSNEARVTDWGLTACDSHWLPCFPAITVHASYTCFLHLFHPGKNLMRCPHFRD